METFKDYPPSQAPASFNIDPEQVLKMLRSMKTKPTDWTTAGWPTSRIRGRDGLIVAKMGWPRKARSVVLNDAPLIPRRTTNRKGPSSVGPKHYRKDRPHQFERTPWNDPVPPLS